jgi:PAS domain S-box-containing protein
LLGLKRIWMDLSFLKGRDAAWNAMIIGSAIIVLGLILAGLLSGITVVLSHLLYIPVVLASYRYPRKGLLFSALICGIYVVLVVLIAGGSPGIIFETLVRVGVIITIGCLIAILSNRLRESEDLYRGLFNHSEAGSILIRDTGQERLILEVNERATKFLKMDAGQLKGAPLTLFWDSREENAVFTDLSSKRPTFSGETIFNLSNGKSARVVISIALLADRRAVLTFIDITKRVNAEHALIAANDKLNFLSRVSSDHLQRNINEIIATVTEAKPRLQDTAAKMLLTKIEILITTVSRRIALSESYRNLGSSPPQWQRVQDHLVSMDVSKIKGDIVVRYWVDRLVIFGDPLFSDVLLHIVENSFQYGGSFNLLVVRYREERDGLNLEIEDNGAGIPEIKKQQIFEYDAGGHKGIGLFVCRQISGVTGMTITETGNEGKGARFEIHIPAGGYRIEGTGEDSPAFSLPTGPSRTTGLNEISGIQVKELLTAEFPLAELLWTDYHQTKADPRTDRIFASFQEGEAVSVARCRKHPDGYEVDAVFTPVQYRGHGYAQAAVSGLVEACGNTTLFMHSVRNLTDFYEQYGFIRIDEKELPPMIRERYAWAGGELEGANVCPMRRDVPP